MKQPTFCRRELLPLSVIEAARAGDPLALERILRYYDRYINKICTQTLYDKDGVPHIGIHEYMKAPLAGKTGGSHRIQEIAKSKEAVKGRDERSAPFDGFLHLCCVAIKRAQAEIYLRPLLLWCLNLRI